MKQLLIDTQDFTYSSSNSTGKSGLVVESSGKNGEKTLIKGILQTANQKNHNGRIYPKHILEREVSRYKEAVKDRQSYGELDHPECQTINLKNLSHVITDIWWEGDNVCGIVEVLPTAMGNILKQLVECNLKLGVSSRGLGSVRESREGTIVGEDFELLCWDVVSTPSTKNAFLTKMNESKEIVNINKIYSPNFSHLNPLIIDILTKIK